MFEKIGDGISMDKLVNIKYKKLYLKDDKLYLFDVPAFVEAMEKKKQISNISIATELELVAKDETQKKRMASRVKSYIRGNDECIGITKAKKNFLRLKIFMKRR